MAKGGSGEESGKGSGEDRGGGGSRDAMPAFQGNKAPCFMARCNSQEPRSFVSDHSCGGTGLKMREGDGKVCAAGGAGGRG